MRELAGDDRGWYVVAPDVMQVLLVERYALGFWNGACAEGFLELIGQIDEVRVLKAFPRRQWNFVAIIGQFIIDHAAFTEWPTVHIDGPVHTIRTGVNNAVDDCATA